MCLTVFVLNLFSIIAFSILKELLCYLPEDLEFWDLDTQKVHDSVKDAHWDNALVNEGVAKYSGPLSAVQYLQYQYPGQYDPDEWDEEPAEGDITEPASKRMRRDGAEAEAEEQAGEVDDVLEEFSTEATAEETAVEEAPVEDTVDRRPRPG